MPGDLVIWRPHTPHSWVAITDAVILTVRWTEEPDPRSVAAT